MATPTPGFIGPRAVTPTDTVERRTFRFPFPRTVVHTLGTVVRPLACCVCVLSESGRSDNTLPTPPPPPPAAPEELVPAVLVERLRPFVMPHGAVGDGTPEAAAQLAEIVAPSARIEPDWHRMWMPDTIVLGPSDGAVDAIVRVRSTARRLPAVAVAAAAVSGRGLPVVRV